MNTRNRRPRGTSTRVRPHIRRRNGVVDAPAELTAYDTPHVSLLYGWRAFG